MRDLFSQFTPVTAKAWKSQLEKDLKGVPVSDLDWKNENGFVIHPFYTAEDQQQVYAPAFTHADWRMMVKAESRSDANVNEFFLRALNGGADAILLDLNQRDLSVALNDIRLDFIHACFFGSPSELSALKIYLDKNYAEQTLSISLFPTSDIQGSELSAWQSAATSISGQTTASADVLHWHNQHCGAALEIAIVFLNLAEFAEKGSLSGKVSIRAGVSADYFVEMAKLRAMRRLWEIFRPEWQSTQDLTIIAETSLTNKTISDRYNNLLRTSVESMAAISGGCNALVVNDYEVLKGDSDNLSQRMALNQQHILKEEAYFDKMSDSACGSFYMEQLTDQLAEKALQHFKEIQEKGGYFASLDSGLIQSRVAEIAKENAAAFERQELLITGVNKYRNEKENLSLSPQRMEFLKALQVENPALHFELQNFFK